MILNPSPFNLKKARNYHEIKLLSREFGKKTDAFGKIIVAKNQGSPIVWV
jgi:hypothetical protein